MHRVSLLSIGALSLFAISLTLTGSAQKKEGALEHQFLSNLRQVTFEGRRSGEGYFSSDGSALVFQSEREPGNPFFQIYRLNLGTGDTKRISPGHGKTTCSWIHPGGKKVLFASTHHDPDARQKQEKELKQRASGNERRYSWDYDEYFDLYEANLETGNLFRLTQSLGYDAEASWSPDGQLIVFSSNRHAYSEQAFQQQEAILQKDPSYFVDIYIMNSDGSNVRRLTHANGYDGGPFFSPNGGKICWRRFSEDGATAEVYTMSIDGTKKEQITQLGAMSWAPFFHPSGDYLIFSTNLHGFSNFELYLVDVRGKEEPVRVTYAEAFDGLPAFSPDGRFLAWTSNRNPRRKSQIFFARWNDTRARQLLGLPHLPQTRSEISADDLRSQVAILASEEMEGRMTGSEGAKRASRYAALILESLGLEPAGDRGTFFGEFEFTAGVSLGSENQLTLLDQEGRQNRELILDQDWRPIAFSKTGRFEPASLCFAGYGIIAPAEGSQPGYDSYTHLDVTDKWLLIFRYLPENISARRRQHLARYSSLRYKAMLARERGARGVLIVSGPTSKVRNRLVELSFDASLGTTGVGVISISDTAAQDLLQSSGKRLGKLQEELDSEKLLMGFDLPSLKVEAHIAIAQEKRIGRNVLARLPAGEDFSTAPAIVVGAHLDHLGHGLATTSLARPGERGAIHYGADDNASGVGGLLEMAEYLTEQKKAGKLPMKRDLVFAFWSGEELGLLGSNSFTRSHEGNGEDGSNLKKHFAAYLNLDMIGRLRDQLIIQGIGSSSGWPREIERANVPIGLPIVSRDEVYLPTDATSFYLKGVPILSVFTGAHEDYHTPRDTAEKLNYEGMKQIVGLMAQITSSLLTSAELPDYRRAEKPEMSASRARLRVYLGTIPDYAQTATEGVQLAGVAGGGPADRAGLKAGDIIIEVAGRKIENIYDYTYALDALKVDELVSVVVLRADQRITLKIVPESRE